MTERTLTKAEYDVAVCVSHCCKQHGCKYGKETCVVVAGTHEQDHACERCQHYAVDLRRAVWSLIYTIREHGEAAEKIVAGADQGLPFTREQLFAKLFDELRNYHRHSPLPEVMTWSEEDDERIQSMPDFWW